jgi:hypothetical protein
MTQHLSNPSVHKFGAASLIELAHKVFSPRPDAESADSEERSKVTEGSVIVFLLGAGAALALLCFYLKVISLKVSTNEFETGVIVAAVLILAGGLFRTFTFYCDYTLKRQELEASLKRHDINAATAQKSVNTASQMAAHKAELAKAGLKDT